MSSTKLKIKSFFFIYLIFLEAHFTGRYNELHIAKKLTWIKHVDLLWASNALNVNYKIRKIYRSTEKKK